jgi:hypothetical protein
MAEAVTIPIRLKARINLLIGSPSRKGNRDYTDDVMWPHRPCGTSIIILAYSEDKGCYG